MAAADNGDPNTDDDRNDASLSEKWKQRFAFYEQRGGTPGFLKNRPEYVAVLDALPFGQYLTVTSNWRALIPVVGIIYFFAIGLWKNAVAYIATLFLAWLAISIVAGLINPNSNIPVSLIFAGLFFMMQTNVYCQRRLRQVLCAGQAGFPFARLRQP